MKGISAEYPMYFGATPAIFKLAKKLRKNETEAEKIIWKKLSKNQLLGLQFRRQHPINRFIADFYCAKIKLVIEIDGPIHEITEYHEHDAGRSEMLNDFGITVVRFTNKQIFNDIEYVINQIELIAKDLLNKSLQPSQLEDFKT